MKNYVSRQPYTTKTHPYFHSKDYARAWAICERMMKEAGVPAIERTIRHAMYRQRAFLHLLAGREWTAADEREANR